MFDSISNPSTFSPTAANESLCRVLLTVDVLEDLDSKLPRLSRLRNPLFEFCAAPPTADFSEANVPPAKEAIAPSPLLLGALFSLLVVTSEIDSVPSLLARREHECVVARALRLDSLAGPLPPPPSSVSGNSTFLARSSSSAIVYLITPSTGAVLFSCVAVDRQVGLVAEAFRWRLIAPL